jgi:hypothetical protein
MWFEFIEFTHINLCDHLQTCEQKWTNLETSYISFICNIWYIIIRPCNITLTINQTRIAKHIMYGFSYHRGTQLPKIQNKSQVFVKIWANDIHTLQGRVGIGGGLHLIKRKLELKWAWCNNSSLLTVNIWGMEGRLMQFLLYHVAILQSDRFTATSYTVLYSLTDYTKFSSFKIFLLIWYMLHISVT